MNKEIEKLKKENKKLRNSLKENGIEPESEVLGKKLGKILTGRELRIAAENKLKVRYVEKYYNPEDRCKNFSADCVMEKCAGDCPDEDGYYIGPSDIDLAQYADDEKIQYELPEGIFEVHRAKGVIYK
jgi:hypothetical protein